MKSKGETEIRIEKATDEAASKSKELSAAQQKLVEYQSKVRELQKEAGELTKRFDSVSANLEDCLRQLAEMSEECYRTSRDMMTQKNRVVQLEKDIENLNNAILEKKAEFPRSFKTFGSKIKNLSMNLTNKKGNYLSFCQFINHLPHFCEFSFRR